MLIYDVQSRRFKWKLLALWLALVGVGLFDFLVQNILGSYWFVLWLVIPLVIMFWVYYAFFLPRAWFVITPDHLLLQTPAGEVKISYGRLDNITSSQMAQHYSLKELSRRDRVLAKPHFKQTCTMLEMNSMPETLQKKRSQLPRILFSTKRPGLLLLVEDWIQLNRDVESAREKWRSARKTKKNGNDDDSRNLAARILEF
ncbi:MAG: hypothetical protein DWQ04_18675 [Chloroflexi bacterium]|nr:MAG: hypothetical protein DWQ04_18675 [Chloroflexota bacterium]